MAVAMAVKCTLTPTVVRIHIIAVETIGYESFIGFAHRPRGQLSPALHCTALHCIALHCTALHCTALHYTALHCTALCIWIGCISCPLLFPSVTAVGPSVLVAAVKLLVEATHVIKAQDTFFTAAGFVCCDKEHKMLESLFMFSRLSGGGWWWLVVGRCIAHMSLTLVEIGLQDSLHPV